MADIQYLLALSAVSRRLRQLYRVATLQEDMAIVRRMANGDLASLLALSIRHRLLLPVHQAILAANRQRDLPDALPPTARPWYAESISEAVAALTQVEMAHEVLLDAIAVQSPLSASAAMLLKGRPLRKWYKSGVQRSSMDVDLSVGDPEEFWQFSAWLQREGYELFELAGAHIDPRDDKVWCLITTFIHPIPGCQLDLKIDLHGPLVSKGYLGFLDVRAMADRAEAGEQQGYYRYPRPSDCMLLLLVEISERSLIVRDAVVAGLL